MSLGNFLNYPLVKGTLSTVLLAVVASAVFAYATTFWPDQPPSYVQHSLGTEAEYVARNLDEDCLALLAVPPASDPTPKQTDDCHDKERAQQYNYANLAQGIRTANAAAYSAYISYLQTCIGIIGAMLVTATLLASAGATWAAHNAARGTIDAANATRDSVDLSIRAFAIAHRPRLRVRKVYAQCTAGEPITIQAEIANVGETVANLFQTSATIEVGVIDSTHKKIVHGAASVRDTIYMIRPGGHLLVKLKTDLKYMSDDAVHWGFMTVRGETIYRDQFAGPQYDLDRRSRFEPIIRKTAFERVQHTQDESGRMRFVKARSPDVEYEFED